MSSDAVITALHRAKSREELLVIEADCVAALAGSMTKALHINSLTEDGQHSSAIKLVTVEQVEEFLSNVQGAIDLHDGKTPSDVPPTTAGKYDQSRLRA